MALVKDGINRIWQQVNSQFLIVDALAGKKGMCEVELDSQPEPDPDPAQP